MRFYTGTQFPAEYRNQMFIAEHGSWNRSHKIGYRVTLVKLDGGGRVQSYQPFAEGWLQGESAWGTPGRRAGGAGRLAPGIRRTRQASSTASATAAEGRLRERPRRAIVAPPGCMHVHVSGPSAVPPTSMAPARKSTASPRRAKTAPARSADSEADALATYARRGPECAYANVRMLGRIVGAFYDEALKPVDLRASQLALLWAILACEPVDRKDARARHAHGIRRRCRAPWSTCARKGS
jgi:hypothetical protein